MIVSLIAAVAENRMIGREGTMGFRIAEDQKRFRRLTMGHHIVMGRRTHRSIGRALDGRTNLVLSANPDYRAEGCVVCRSYRQAYELARVAGEEELFVIGGAGLYGETLPVADRLYLTHVHRALRGDVFFPPLGPDWVEVHREDHAGGEPLPYSFVDYERADRDRDPLRETVRQTRSLYDGGYLRLEELTVEREDGAQARREVVGAPDAAAVLPIDTEGRVYLIRQHRPAIGRTILEAPAGIIDEGESAEQTAARECAEEAGQRPGRLIPVLTYAHAEGYSSGYLTVFIGLDLEPSSAGALDEGERLQRVVLSFEELLSMVNRNIIIDSKTTFAVRYWEKWRNLLS